MLSEQVMHCRSLFCCEDLTYGSGPPDLCYSVFGDAGLRRNGRKRHLSRLEPCVLTHKMG
jgi:hypothetical protein